LPRRRSTSLARGLRRRLTDAERHLWRRVRARRLGGLKFRRQEPIGGYIVDFVCFEKRVVIELDGSHHAVQVEEDRVRDEWFEGQGFRLLRFLDNEVLTNLDGVLETISSACLWDHTPRAE
jgi:very-short-patch-repair endonuclease